MLIAPSSLALFMTGAMLLLLVPGPAVLYITSRSIGLGRAAGLVSAMGIAVGTLFHAAAATLGLSALLVSSAAAFQIVKYAGAAYLIYLGIRTLRGGDAPALDPSRERISLRRVFGQGVLVNLLNPKTALFFLAFLPQFVDPSRGHATLQIFELGVLFALMGLTSDGLYALVAGTAGRWVKRNGHYLRWERYLTGGVFIGLGVTAALAGNGRK